MDHSDIDHGFAAGGELFVVLAQAAVAAEPPEGALNDPALGQHDKACPVVGTLDDLQDAAQEGVSPGDQTPAVGAVGPDFAEAGEVPLHPCQDELGTGAILDVGRMHHHREYQSQGVDGDVTLAPGDQLAAIEAADPPFSVVLTVWESRTAALGVGSRPALTRTLSRRQS